MSNGPVLVTGFEPFDGHTINVSWEVARALDGRVLVEPAFDQRGSDPGEPEGLLNAPKGFEALRWVAGSLPCRFGDCTRELERLMIRHAPALVLCLGQAEGRSEITIERVALNVRDARIPDNGGHQPLAEPVVADGPYAYPSRLPVRDMVDALRASGHPVAISNTAGTFVCNDLFYGLMHLLRDTTMHAGFIHLPILPEQRRGEHLRSAERDDAPRGFDAHTPALPLERQVAAIEAAGRLARLPDRSGRVRTWSAGSQVSPSGSMAANHRDA